VHSFGCHCNISVGDLGAFSWVRSVLCVTYIAHLGECLRCCGHQRVYLHAHTNSWYQCQVSFQLSLLIFPFPPPTPRIYIYMSPHIYIYQDLEVFISTFARPPPIQVKYCIMIREVMLILRRHVPKARKKRKSQLFLRFVQVDNLITHTGGE